MSESPAASDAAGLSVVPFRGVRYDRVSDLAAVTSPPYDVIDADSAAQLELLDPHNVVRLILPRDEAETGTGRYEHAARQLRQWLADQTLRRDEQPALYVYEQSTDSGLQRGVLAAVGLRDPADRVVLPHEDVLPGPVADRLDLMRATSANLEPILLVYDGGGVTAQIIDQVAGGPPLAQARTDDGVLHRLWPVTDPQQQRAMSADLQHRQALIADGHHRYATYRRLQAEHQAAGHGAGPWDQGLALLVDATTYPLRVAAIHRVVAGLALDDAVSAVRSVFKVSDVRGSFADALATLEAATGRHPFVLTDGREFSLIEDPDPAALAGAWPPERSALWRSLDAAVLNDVLLARVWGVDDADPRTRYVHVAERAVRLAGRVAGTAVLLRPASVEQVLAVAAAGERMPRKSTSFGPKPRTGLVLRLLSD
ncbi:MAG: hypothetical protein QOE01_1602 [Actinomycetota bacterium]|jgi:uncharacterized protein (DUF1015 family)|nr:hypothetical protein [Actinomycetota bacterium]